MFNGGIKLIDFKELSKEEKIEDFKEPEKVIIPLSQHTGIPAKPVVKKADKVKQGQIIGEGQGFISSYIHSPISGIVTGIEKVYLPTGKISEGIIIENDGLNEKIEYIKRNWNDLSKEEIIKIVYEAGIVGLGGAGFPTHVKLSIPTGKKAEYVILNGCECEPFLTCDYRVLKEKTDQVLEGLYIIKKVVEAEKGIIAIESNKVDIVDKIKNVIKEKKVDIDIKILQEKYPQGSEKHLIKSITKREVPSGKLPIDVGCIIFNVQTSLSIKKAVCDGIPLIERVLTITGVIEKRKNLNVKIGTLISEIIQSCGSKPERTKIIIGGPMMGINIFNENVPVIKGTTGILILPEEILPDEVLPCIRCGKCLDVCPMKLMPNMLSLYSENEMWDKAMEYFPADCIECGCCAYVCSAKRPIVQHIKIAKLNIKR